MNKDSCELQYVDNSLAFWIERCLLAESMLEDISDDLRKYKNYERWNELKSFLELPILKISNNATPKL